jgi:hypothetical protein
MRSVSVIGVFLVLLLGAIPGDAQTTTPPSSPSADRMTDVRAWMRAYTEWKEWWAEWRNRPEPGFFVDGRTRREKPAPPKWLMEACGEWLDVSDPLAPACELVAEWADDDLTAAIRQRLTKGTADRETPSRRTFWEHIHLDLMWPALDADSGIFGVAGTHVTITVKKRAHVFAAPGAMFVNLPTKNGGRAWKLATNYGIGFHLFDFIFPGGHPAEAHINMAKAWLLADTRDVVSGRTMDFVGFSITFKKVR